MEDVLNIVFISDRQRRAIALPACENFCARPKLVNHRENTLKRRAADEASRGGGTQRVKDERGIKRLIQLT
jgi:hypothetical protein